MSVVLRAFALMLIGAALAVAAPAAHSAAPTPAPTAANQLWYRVSVSVKGSYNLQSRGETQVQENSWNLHSNTAVLVKRVCVIDGSGISAAAIATLKGVRGGWSCAELLRDFTPAQARVFSSRLREDFFFAANATGSADKWKATTTQAPRTERHNGKNVQCPGGHIDRELRAPIATVGRIGGSARNGVVAGFNTPDGKWVIGGETRSFVECRDPDTGEVVFGANTGSSDVPLWPDVLAGMYAPVHGSGSGGSEYVGGALLLEPIKIGSAGHLFGHSFTLSGAQRQTHRFPENFGSSSKSVAYTMHFTICPGGGRNVGHC